MTELRITPLTADNVVAANTLTLKPGQEAFVAPVSHSISEAYVNQDTMWPRVVEADGEVVGFIMADHQRQGVGAFAVNAVLTEALNRGFDRVIAVWEDGDLGPGRFFEAMGFKVVGETPYGEVIGERRIMQ